MIGDYFTIDDILAVIVLYKTEPIFSNSFFTLHESLKITNAKIDLVLYDNSPEPMCDPKDLEHLRFRLTYIHDPSNPGVSKAYNVAAKLAAKMHKKWLLLLDDDTEFPEDGMKRYVHNLNENRGYEMYAPIIMSSDTYLSPSRYKWSRGFAPDYLEPGSLNLKKYHPINSGVLISTALFLRAGGYDEKLRLDFSDFHFMNKLTKFTGDFMVIDLTLEHSLSSIENRFDPAKMLSGYRNHCEGARIFSEGNIFRFIQLFIVVFLRGLKLAFIYYKPQFIGAYFTKFLFLKNR